MSVETDTEKKTVFAVLERIIVYIPFRLFDVCVPSVSPCLLLLVVRLVPDIVVERIGQNPTGGGGGNDTTRTVSNNVAVEPAHESDPKKMR